MWDFLAIVGIISLSFLFLMVIFGTFSKNKIDTEAFKQSIINEYLEEEKKKIVTEKSINNNKNYVIPNDAKFLGDDFLSILS